MKELVIFRIEITCYKCIIPGMKSTRIPNRSKLMIILIIPANKPRLTATSEGAMLGLILITELITELTSRDTVAILNALVFFGRTLF